MAQSLFISKWKRTSNQSSSHGHVELMITNNTLFLNAELIHTKDEQALLKCLMPLT